MRFGQPSASRETALHAALQPLRRARDELWREKPRRIDRPWHRNAARRQRTEAEGPVIGLIADENDERPAGLPRRLHHLAHQRLAVALSLVEGIDDERAEEQPVPFADPDRRHADRTDQRPAKLGQEGKRRVVWRFLAHAKRGARVGARPEGGALQAVDGVSVGWPFKTGDDIRAHGNSAGRVSESRGVPRRAQVSAAGSARATSCAQSPAFVAKICSRFPSWRAPLPWWNH